MKTAFVALFLIASAFAIEVQTGTSTEDLRNLWTAWKGLYNKGYATTEEDEHRFGVFSANYFRILAWNSEEHTSSLALNKFADLTNEEFGAQYAGTSRLPTPATDFADFDTNNLPSTVDWVKAGAVTNVKNQQQCGSCWSFSATGAVEGIYKIQGNTLTSFSEQQIIDCDSSCMGCNGCWANYAIDYAAKEGLEPSADYPYKAVQGTCHYNKAKAIKATSGSQAVTTQSADALRAALVNQPVSISVEADEDAFQFYSGGVITTGCGDQLDHAILAVGYGSYSNQDGFKVKNSWGSDWGLDGYLWISGSQKYNNGDGACGIFASPYIAKKL